MIRYHVGSNIPGYLPELDVACFESIESAVEYFKAELRSQQDHYYEQCEGHCEDCAEFERTEECECRWCDVAGDVEAVFSSIADHDVEYSVKVAGRYDAVLRPQIGSDIAHWVYAIKGCDCEEV